MDEIPLEELQTFYPVLTGRYIGYQILLAPEKIEKIKSQFLWPLLEKSTPHYVLIEVIPALLISRNFELIKTIFKTHYEDLYEMDHWHAYTSLNVFLAAESIISIYQKDYKQAKIAYDSMTVNLIPHSYLDYIMIFRLIAEYHLSKTHLLDVSKSKVLNEFISLVNRLGFHRFNKRFLVNYFD